MPTKIPYLVLKQKPPESCSILFCGFALDLPENGTVQNLVDYVASDFPDNVQLDESYKPAVYTLPDPIPDHLSLTDSMIAKELGIIDPTFYVDRARSWAPKTPLSELGIKTEGKHLQVLVIFSLIHPRRSLESIREDGPEYNHFSREEILKAARKRDSPSQGAQNLKLLATQNENKPDAIYNGRPYQLTAPPIEIYHPVFATFRRKMAQPIEDFEFSATELGQVHTLILNSLAFYDSEMDRQSQLDDLKTLVHPLALNSNEIPNGGSRYFKPDGAALIGCKKIFPPKNVNAAILFFELKNGVGDGGSDPISQSQCDYTAFYSSELRQPLRDACCCPAFLLGIAGPYLIISGAVFADRFISQNLTDYLYLGGSPFIGPRLREIAKVLRVLKECLTDLEGYYSELAPTSSVPPSSRSVSLSGPTTRSLSKSRSSGKTSTSVFFPHFKKFTHATSGQAGQDVELEYTERLMPYYSEKAVFKALARFSGSDVASTVVVKFTATYCQEAHELLQEHSLAPRLWFCGIVESVGMHVVVMDFIAARQISKAGLSPDEARVLREALQMLHDNKLVYGDLRNPNIMLPKEGKLPMLIDFDWSGKAGTATYPPDLNMDIRWHEDVCRGGLIHRDHDVFMLDQLEQGSG